MKIEKIIHKNEARIKVEFSYSRAFIALIKQIPGALWSQTLKSWHLPYTSESYELLKKLFVNHLTNEKMILLLRDYYREYKPKYWLFEGINGEQYSKSSIQIYTHITTKGFDQIKNPLDDLDI